MVGVIVGVSEAHSTSGAILQNMYVFCVERFERSLTSFSTLRLDLLTSLRESFEVSEIKLDCMAHNQRARNLIVSRECISLDQLTTTEMHLIVSVQTQTW